jgi:hypothetical protein
MIPFAFQAQKLDVKNLVVKCLDFIDVNCEKLIESDDFLDATPELLIKICLRDTLIVSEIDLYLALIRWSEQELHRRSLGVTVLLKKSVLSPILAEHPRMIRMSSASNKTLSKYEDQMAFTVMISDLVVNSKRTAIFRLLYPKPVN